MSEDNQLSRRQSLVGIGAAGATLTGLAGCLGNDETAGEAGPNGTEPSAKGDDGTSDEAGKKGTLGVEVVCHEAGEAQVRVRNDATQKVEVDWKVSIDDLDRDALEDLLAGLNGDLDDLNEDDFDDLDDLDDYDGDVLEEFLSDYDIDPDDLEGKQIALEGTTLTIGKREVDLRALAAQRGIDLDDAPIDLEKLSGTLTVPKGADKSFWAGVLTTGANVDLYYDGKKVDSVSVDAADCMHGDEKEKAGGEIDVEAVCYRMRKVDFADLDDTQLENTYDSDVTGVSEDFDPDGEMLLNGEEVDEDDYDDLVDDDDTDVLAESDLDGTADLEGLEGVAKVREATFRVHNHGKQKAKIGWTVEGTAQGGKLTVKGKDSATFTVTERNDRKTFVTVTHDGEEIASVKPADTECTDDHDGDDDNDDD